MLILCNKYISRKIAWKVLFLELQSCVLMLTFLGLQYGNHISKNECSSSPGHTWVAQCPKVSLCCGFPLPISRQHMVFPQVYNIWCAFIWQKQTSKAREVSPFQCWHYSVVCTLLLLLLTRPRGEVLSPHFKIVVGWFRVCILRLW